MILSYLRAFSLALLLTSISAQAAYITSINNLSIDGTFYNIRFHTGQSFNDLFDADGDHDFSDNDGSLFNRAPTFWGNQASALRAAQAIISELGVFDHTNPQPIPFPPSDHFLIPFARQLSQTDIAHALDFQARLDIDSLAISALDGSRSLDTFPIATFELAPNPVPVPIPPSLVLTALALGMMVYVSRTRRVY